MLHARFDVKKVTFDKERFLKNRNIIIKEELQHGAREFLRAVILSIPSYSGVAKASLRPLATFLKLAVPIARRGGANIKWRWNKKTNKVFPIFGQGLDYEKTIPYGESVGRRTYEIRSNDKEHRFSFSMPLFHFNKNDAEDLRNDPHWTWLGNNVLGINPPWKSFKKARAAAAAYFNNIKWQKRLPNWKTYLKIGR